MASLFEASMLIGSRRQTRMISDEDDVKHPTDNDKSKTAHLSDLAQNAMDLERLTSSAFNQMLTEITEKEEAEDSMKQLKKVWKIGSKVEIYSFSEKRWVDAELIRIFSDKEGEWLAVKYLNNKIKEIQRFNKFIRPTAIERESHAIETQNTIDIDREDSLSEAHHSMFDLVRNKNFVIKDDDIEDEVNWDKILSAISTGNIQFIKTLITSSSIDINEQHPGTGKTILIYSVIIGNYDLVAVLCNFGSNVYIKDNDQCDALHYAKKYGQYRITELLYYRQLSGALGKDLKDIATKLYQKKRESKLLKAFKHEDAWDEDNLLHHLITKYVINVIEKREVFGKDMLFYAWYFVTNDEKTKKNPLESDLFKTMMKTFSEILCNTEDKVGWKWLRKYFVDSLIWYLPHPINVHKAHTDNDDNDDTEAILQKTLFYELLIRVRQESKRLSDLLLKHEIWKIKREKANDWQQLTEYNVVTKYSSNARQDICGCLQPKYTKEDLSEDVYPPSIHFNAKQHYDKYIYLNELMFRANILDAMFQKDVRNIARQICNESNGKIFVRYRAGPVKTLKRSRTKVDNDYINEKYPTSAKILDINRCALQFKDIASMMKFIHILNDKIRKKQAHSIKSIIRSKNGWSVYNQNYPQYTDIKLSVLIQSPHDEKQMIVGEIQFLLDLMSGFKKKSHKLYGVERLYEMVYNYNKLVSHMQSFKDNHGTNATLIDLAKNDDIYYFRLLWTTIHPTTETLIGHQALSSNVWDNSLFHIMYKNGNINIYLKREYSDLYEATIAKYFRNHVEKYGFLDDKVGFLNSISSNCNEADSKDMILAKWMTQMFCSLQNNLKKWKKMIKLKDENKRNLIHGICHSEHRYKQCTKLILNSSILSYKEMLNIFEMKGYKKGPFDNRYLDVAMEIIRYVQYDKGVFINIIKGYPLLAICKSKDRLSYSILRLILNNPLLSTQDIFKLFDYRDDMRRTPLYYAVKEGYYQNVQFFLHHFGDKKRQIITWLNATENDTLLGADNECILLILRYFKNDKTMLLSLLQQKKQKENTRVFDEICREKKLKSLKCILYECSSINHKDILQLLCNKECCREKSPIFDTSDGIFSTGMEIIKYFKNDRIPFFKLLSTIITDGMNIFMALCDSVDDDNEDNNYIALRLILAESALTQHDIYKLLSFKNKEYKTAMYYAFGSWYRGAAHIFFDTVNERYLVKLLSQETEKEDQICAIECRKEQHIERVIDIIISAGAHFIAEELLSKKDDLRSSVKEELETYEVYYKSKEVHTMLSGRFAQMEDVIAEKTAKLDELTEEKREKFLEACTQIRALKVQLEQPLKEVNKAYFVSCCKLGQYEAVQSIMEKDIGDSWSKLLIYLSLDKDLIKSILCRYNKDDRILKLLLLNNEITKKAVSMQLLSKQTPFFEAEQHHLLSVIEHFKDDGGILYKWISETNKDNKQVFDCICESKKKEKHNTIKSLLAYLPRQHVLKLLYHRFKIRDYNPDDNRVHYDEISLRNAFIYGVGEEIIDWAKNDRKLLLKLLSTINTEAVEQNAKCCDLTPLMLACRGRFEDRDDSKFEDNFSVKRILNESALNHRDKIDLISRNSTNDNVTVLHTTCEFGKDSINALQIVNYFANEQEVLIKWMSVKAKSDADTCLIKAVKKGKLGFIEAIFRAIEDNDAMLKLLLMKNKKFETALDLAKEMSTQSWEERELNYKYKYEIEEAIESWFDYIHFDKLLCSDNIEKDVTSFEEYATNPWLTCCKYGKYNTICKLLDYINCSIEDHDEKNAKLKRLLLDNYDIGDGSNGLMIALEHKNNEIISEIFRNVTSTELKLQLLSIKNFSGETMLNLWCKDDNNLYAMCNILEKIDCDKKSVYELLVETGRGNKSCQESRIYQAVCSNFEI